MCPQAPTHDALQLVVGQLKNVDCEKVHSVARSGEDVNAGVGNLRIARSGGGYRILLFPTDCLIAWLIQINFFVNKYRYGIFWNVHSKKIQSYVA